MPSRRFRLPAAARPPLALALVGGTIAAAIATGQAGSAMRPAAASRPAPAAPAAASAPLTAETFDVHVATTTLQRRDVVRALRALDSEAPQRASRGQQRAALTRHQARALAHPWVRPNYGPLTSPFGYRWGRLHAGIDLAGPYGSPIVAATDGCITYAGPMDGYGEVMQIRDWDGTETVYGHMSAFLRRSGCVKAGQVIARVGAAGDATGPHLHFEVRVGGQPVDPIPFLAKRGLHL